MAIREEQDLFTFVISPQNGQISQSHPKQLKEELKKNFQTISKLSVFTAIVKGNPPLQQNTRKLHKKLNSVLNSPETAFTQTETIT